MPASVRFIADGAEIDKLLRGDTGPVVRWLTDTATIVVEMAKRKVGYDEEHTGPSIPRGRGGNFPGQHLRDTIVKRYLRGQNPTMWVGSEHPIALLHHEGTAPHMIYPTKAKVLAFRPRGGDRVVFAREVSHPGTKPNRYLTDPLREVLTMRLGRS